ncbi:hypothetical protein [Streptomyces luteolus]|uniref:Uncharacterized protein n=1 Tax=Streptomyces luteolus TaxID=3043615 RepID=A0ABT6T8U6_9ACTN|nr:hypothetical protein [Streptomyces sp. B-S-A12]MDI3424312.1 hypothetical protein [Streptomyces sp. B-S-A12]
MNMTKTPQPTASPTPSAAPVSSTPIYDTLVREWYAEGRDSGTTAGGRRDDAATAGASGAGAGSATGSAAA